MSKLDWAILEDREIENLCHGAAARIAERYATNTFLTEADLRQEAYIAAASKAELLSSVPDTALRSVIIYRALKDAVQGDIEGYRPESLDGLLADRN